MTPAKDWIYITITCYISIDNCIQPACITKDLSLIFYARDSSKTTSLPRSLRNLIYGPAYESRDANAVSGIYHLTIKQAAELNSPSTNRRYSRRVIDSTSSYVRGEEMLDGWRPRSDSLIFEHQWELEKLSRLQHVEKTKHFLLLKETLDSLKQDNENEKLDENESNLLNNNIKNSNSKNNMNDDNKNDSDAIFNDVNTNKNNLSSSLDNNYDENDNIKCKEDEENIDNQNDKSFSSSSTSLASSGSIMSTYDDKEKELLLKCIKFINQGRPIINRDKTTPSMSNSRSVYDGISTSTSLYNFKQTIPNINVNN